MTQNSESEDWNDCQPGEIQGVVNSLRRQRRNKQLTQSAVAGTSLVLLFAVALFSLPDFSGNATLNHQVLAYREVAQNAEDYVAGRLSNLVKQQVETHLSSCPHCQKHVDALRVRFESDGSAPPVLKNQEFTDVELSLNSELVHLEYDLLLASQ